jgi:hypothetical protein
MPGGRAARKLAGHEGGRVTHGGRRA